jgi:GAF domain-containing protein
VTEQFAKRRDDPFRWVLDVSAMLMVAPGERESLQRVAQAIGEGMNVSGADILSYDAEKSALVQEAAWDPEGISAQDLDFLGTVIPLDENPMFKRLIVSRRVEERHSTDIDLTDDEHEMFAEWGYKTTLDAPLIVGDELVGALGVTEKRYERRFMSTEIQRFEKFAAMAAAAIRNQRVFRREQQQSRRLDVLLEISRLLTTSADLREGVIAATQALATSLGAAWTALYETPGAAGGAPRLLAWRANAAAAGAPAGDAPSTPVGADADNGAHDEGTADAAGGADEGANWLDGVAHIMDTHEAHVASAADPATPEALGAEMLRRHERARLGLPLLCHGSLVGALVMAFADSDLSDQGDRIEFALSAAELLAVGLENGRLEAAI